MIAASCEVYLDGTFYPSTPAEAAGRRPVVLAPLAIEWGRSASTEQPDTATASLTVRVWNPPDDLLSLVHVGTDVEIWAAGSIPVQGDPVGANTYVDGSFSTQPDGPADPSVWQGAGSATFVAGALVLDPDNRDPTGWAALPPAPFDATPGAWDGIATAEVGDRWAWSITVDAPAGHQFILSLTGWTAPDRATRFGVTTWPALPTITAPGGPVTYSGETQITGFERPGVRAWLGLNISVNAGYGRWSDAVGTWADAVGPWSSVAVATATIDDLSLAPLQATTRRVLVHSGAVTDLAWAAVDDEAVDIGLIAVDMSGPLGNRVIGDEPWPVQTVADRAARIIALTGLPIALDIDPGVAGYQLTARDVDAQESLALLRDIAQSAGAVLWPATYATTGPYLWLEDPATRASVRVFVWDDLTGTVIIDNPRDPGGGLAVVSACDIVRDPVVWRQATGDVTTLVDVTWLEQTLNEDGELDPTERHVTLTNDAAIATYGLNRLSLGTELIAEADASALAARLLDAASELLWRVDGVTYDTLLVADDIDSLSNHDRMSTLMDLLDGTRRIGLGLSLIDLPAYAPIPGDTAGTYVEGGTYRYENDAWSLALKLSPTPSAGASATWADMKPGWSWEDMAAGISWADATGTGVA